MFKIGEFSQLTHVSVRMLRHYDALGLLKPARVDPHTDYRYYSADQLPRLNRILALKDLGFTLEQVGTLLHGHVSAAELRGMLRLRQVEIAQRISDDAAQLARVEAQLKLIEQEGTMSKQNVVIKSIPAQLALAKSTQVKEMQGQGAVIGPAFEAVFAALGRAGGQITGPAAVLYHMRGEDDHVIQVAVPVAPGIVAPAGFELTELPAQATVASTFHLGNIGDIGASWQDLMRWMELNGYRPAGSCREVHVQFTEVGDAANVTELIMPVARG